MSARLKFNLAMVAGLAVAIAIASWVVHGALQRDARAHVMQRANLLMAAAEATRAYTTKFIKPQLDQRLDVEFLPQTVPAFAATETVISLRKQFPEYTYKEATLNPTNPRNRTTDWEADIVHMFRSDPTRKEIVGERMQGPIAALYMAKPIRVTSPSCLSCHATPSSAPASLIKLYGEANGFGWKHDEIIGAQIVSVPVAVSDGTTTVTFWTIIGVMIAIALVALVIANVLFGRLVVIASAGSSTSQPLPEKKESPAASRWARR
jgi:hypothetical protein